MAARNRPQHVVKHPRFRRVIYCLAAGFMAGLVAGLLNTLAFFGFTLVVRGSYEGSLMAFFGFVLLGLLVGVLYGCLCAIPFALVSYRKEVRKCEWWAIGVNFCAILAVVLFGLIVHTVLVWRSSDNQWLREEAMMWLCMLVPLAGFFVALIHIARRLPDVWLPYPTGCCQLCGYDRRGLASDAAPCPECGSAIRAGRRVAGTLDA